MSNVNSTLYKTSNIKLFLPAVKESGHGIVPTSSTINQLSIGDALAVALMERREFRSENFHAFHPGGKLGSKLATVEQLMQIRKDLAIVKESTPMKEVLIKMTSSSFGVAIVEKSGSLIGIITDGDLRRNVKDLFSKTAGMVATLHPGTIGTRDLASKALHLMQKRKSYSMPLSYLIKMDTIVFA